MRTQWCPGKSLGFFFFTSTDTQVVVGLIPTRYKPVGESQYVFLAELCSRTNFSSRNEWEEVLEEEEHYLIKFILTFEVKRTIFVYWCYLRAEHRNST